ncbi:MAG: hypothetical protein PWP46_1163 [Fusobacteriaceae bacterium]|nr:hypothetical protein [Fusobacteriaceae bacterium]
MFRTIINFYAMGGFLALISTAYIVYKYKKLFKKAEYTEKHYVVLFFIMSLSSWYFFYLFFEDLKEHSDDIEDIIIEIKRQIDMFLDEL